MIKAGNVVNEAHINTRNAVIAIYYFNPISQNFYLLQKQMTEARKDVWCQHPTEDLLIEQLQQDVLWQVEFLGEVMAHKLFGRQNALNHYLYDRRHINTDSSLSSA